MRYFFTDESGHTGPNLFDKNQPFLYYGTVSTNLNIDLLGSKYIPSIRKKLGVERLHAAELGNGRLVEILPDLQKLDKKFKFVFDLYRVNKIDHALISFFDQIFDQGMNPAVPWSSYWTPLRYVLVFKLSLLFDENSLKEAWKIRIERNNKKAEERLSQLCDTLLAKAALIPDERSREIIFNALFWAKANPSKIDYNASSKHEFLSITPNLVGFQFVMKGIADRIKLHKVKKPFIVIDQQSQFNTTQKSLAQFYADAKASQHKFFLGPGLPDIDFSHMPEVPINIKSGKDSYGLELVDIYLWIFKRKLEGKFVAQELESFISKKYDKGMFDELSLQALENRWVPYFDSLPNLTTEQEAAHAQFLKFQE
jgi:hypothetical protein